MHKRHKNGKNLINQVISNKSQYQNKSQISFFIVQAKSHYPKVTLIFPPLIV